MKTYEIKIQTNPRAHYTRYFAVTATEVGVIYLGVMAGSSAMQWAGFLGVMLLGLSLAHSAGRRDTSLSITEARKRLDDIEAQEVSDPARGKGGAA